MRAPSSKAVLWVWIVLMAVSGLPMELVEHSTPHACGDECSCESLAEASCCAKPDDEPEEEPLSCCSEPESESSDRGLVLTASCSCHDPMPGSLVIDGPPRLVPDWLSGLFLPAPEGAYERGPSRTPTSVTLGPDPPPPRVA